MRISCAVVFDQGRILITKRPAAKHLGNLWEFPGGKLRQWEGPKRGLRREVREELGIWVSVQELIHTVCHRYEDSSAQEHQLFFYLCKLQKGRPQPRASQALMWVAPEELITLAFPPADQDLIQKLPEEIKRLTLDLASESNEQSSDRF